MGEAEEEEEEEEEEQQEGASRWLLVAVVGPDRVVDKRLLREASRDLLGGVSGASGKHF